MAASSVSDLVRTLFAAFEKRDRETVERLLADDFTFSSPNGDDHISRTEYFEKCWPGGEAIRGYRFLNLFEQGNEAFVRYECELKDGKKFRNTEYLRVEGDQVVEVDVYFGRDVTA